MYIGQAPQEANDETAPVKKKNKASFVVFFINLFLMAVAFFVIKNNDKSRIESQKDSSSADEGTLAEEATVAKDAVSPAIETNQADKLNVAEGNVGTDSTQPIIVPKNIGVSVTTPPASTNTSSKKPAKKTKTS